MTKKTIDKGIYLIIDPSVNQRVLLDKLQLALEEEMVAVQVWDNFKEDSNSTELVQEITRLCHAKNIPVLINNRWQLLLLTDVDGVHFDAIPGNYHQLKQQVEREIITGITCGNNLAIVQWAAENKLDYISFCSLFPSSTANSCELVSFDTIREAGKITSIPIFLAGGIIPERMPLLEGLGYSGIAVVSGVMNAGNPAEQLKNYQTHLKL